MKVKVCGLTRRVDVERCAERGATHVGFVLVPGTPRCVPADRVRELAADLPAGVEPVLVFRDPEPAAVLAAARASGVRRVQLHRFTAACAARLEAGGLLVHRVRDAFAAAARGALEPFDPLPAEDRPWHLDAAAGGGGRPFDWRCLTPEAPRSVFIAGGLSPANLPALLELSPWGIDLSSGVEERPGVKDPRKLDALFRLLEEVP